MPVLLFFIMGLTVPLRGALPWAGVSPGGDGAYSVQWLGRVWDAGQGWIWHEELGWMYASGNAPQSVYFYKPGLGWLWSGASSASCFYSWDVGGWIWHAPGTADPQWFYDYSASRWVADCMDGVGVEDVSSRLVALPAQSNVPAIACAMTVRGKVVAHGWAGVLRKGYAGDAGPPSKWEIASCSKSAACLVAAELVAEGKLGWYDKLPALLPGVSMNAGWREVTLFDLVHHVSGMDDSAVYTYFNPFTPAGATLTAQRRTMALSVLSRAPAKTPKVTYDYSGIGYTLAGHILETKAGVAYEDLVRSRIFAKLGLSSGGFFFPAAPLADRNTQPWGHIDGVPVDPTVTTNEVPVIILPAGGIHLTVDDFARYAAAHTAGEEGLCVVLEKASWSTLHHTGSTANADYAFGWTPAEAEFKAILGEDAVCHTGNSGSFVSLMIAAPSAGVSVVAATNEGDYNIAYPAVKEAVRRILASQGYE
jgi:CubicO group peptidase (beta-lactamase class C family)